MGLRRYRIGAATLAMALGLATPGASAQIFGDRDRSLGGFGGAMAEPVAGPMLIPYGGSFDGFLPGRMGGGASLSFRARPSAPIAFGRRDFRMSPMPGARARPMEGLGDVGSLLGGPRRGRVGIGSSVMPPRIGSPFRQPPSLLGPSM